MSRPLIVAALKEELAPLRRKPPIAPATLRVLGDGAPTATDALVATLDALPSPPGVVLVAGFCGALDPAFERGRVVAITRMVAHDRDGVPEPDPNWTARLEAAGAQIATLSSARGLISGRAERLALGRLTGAQVVDLESAALARVCAERSLPFAVLRVVSDALDDDLHPHVLAAARADGSVSRAGVIVRTLATPWEVPSLLRFARRAATSARRAADVLVRAIDA